MKTRELFNITKIDYYSGVFSLFLSPFLLFGFLNIGKDFFL